MANNTWTITPKLTAGDVIYLTLGQSVNEGKTVNATLNIQPTQAA